jgi:hypothetical protein
MLCHTHMWHQRESADQRKMGGPVLGGGGAASPWPMLAIWIGNGGCAFASGSRISGADGASSGVVHTITENAQGTASWPDVCLVGASCFMGIFMLAAITLSPQI